MGERKKARVYRELKGRKEAGMYRELEARKGAGVTES